MMMQKPLLLLGLLALVGPLGYAQYGTFSQEQRAEYTSEFEGERFADGRPKVSDDILERMKKVSIEQAWGVLRSHGYHNQFDGDWYNLHPDRVFVGRAVTASFVPERPDLHETTKKKGDKDGRIGAMNSWVIDTLQKNDVIVVDLFGKIIEGTFAGDNLATSINSKTQTGMVIDGGIRDLDGIYALDNFNALVRGVDPSAWDQVTLMGINIPIRIGRATVMPGDVVLARREGVIFIPPHLAKEVVDTAEEVQRRDAFGHQMLREGRFTPGQIDGRWTEEIQQAYEEWQRERLNEQEEQ